MTRTEALEQQLKGNQTLVEVRDMALKLSENREFRKLILEGFCLTESARYAHESADPHMSAEQRADALAMAQAGGHLKRFLSMAVVVGNTASRELVDVEEALEHIRTHGEEEEAFQGSDE